MIDDSTLGVRKVLKRMQEIVGQIENAAVAGDHKDGLSPAVLLRRVIDNVDRLASVDDSPSACKDDPSSVAASALTRLSVHLNIVHKMLEVEDSHAVLPTIGRALLSLAGIYQALGENAAAVRIFQRWLQRNDARHELVTRGHVQLQLGSILADLGDWTAATHAINDSLTVLATVRDHAGIISAQIVLGKIAYKQGKYPHAREFFEQALNLAEDSNDVRHIGTTKMQLGVIARMQGRSHYALACFQDALIQFQSAQDDVGTAECLNHLGVLHLQNRRLREADSCIEKSIGLCRDNGWALVLAYGYLNKAAVQIEADDRALAATTCAKGLELMVRLQNAPGLAKAARLCAQILASVGELAAARGFLEISMELYEKFSIPLGLANCYFDIAQLLQHHDDPAAASYLARAQEIFKTLDLPTNARVTRRRLREFQHSYQMDSFTLEET